MSRFLAMPTAAAAMERIDPAPEPEPERAPAPAAEEQATRFCGGKNATSTVTHLPTCCRRRRRASRPRPGPRAHKHRRAEVLVRVGGPARAAWRRAAFAVAAALFPGRAGGGAPSSRPAGCSRRGRDPRGPAARRRSARPAAARVPAPAPARPVPGGADTPPVIHAGRFETPRPRPVSAGAAPLFTTAWAWAWASASASSSDSAAASARTSLRSESASASSLRFFFCSSRSSSRLRLASPARAASAAPLAVSAVDGRGGRDGAVLPQRARDAVRRVRGVERGIGLERAHDAPVVRRS